MDDTYEEAMVFEQDSEIERTVLRERSRLLGFIRKRVRQEEDAQDILQDVFWQLTEAYRRLETIERVTSWLFQVARNKIVDTYRKKSREAAATRLREEDSPPRLEDLIPSLSEDPEESYLRDALWGEIEEAIDALPPMQRDVFIWHELEGMSFREMSELTGVTENALRLRKLYAVRRLRKELESLYNDL